MNLSNNTILITGGTSGLGFELSKQLIERGNTVIITGRDVEKLNRTKKLLPKIHIFQSDVTDSSAISALYDNVITQFPELNVLINNAGIMLKLNLQSAAVTVDSITEEIDTNLIGPIRMTQQFLPHLKTKKDAVILNVTSGLALVPFPLSPVYGATKSGLRSYTKSLRVQLENTTIKVFELIAPAAKTPLNDKFANDIDSKMSMEPEKLIAATLKGLGDDDLEIYPGLSKIIYFMSRLAPGIIFNEMAKVARTSLGFKK